MAAKLLQAYEQAAKEFGAAGRVKLAMLTKFTSARAGEASDSSENVLLFERPLAQLRATKSS